MNAKDYMLQEVEIALERARLRIISRIDELNMRASGKTQDSLYVEMDSDGGRLIGRAYFQGLQIGRPNGATPKGFVGIIKQWLRDKGIALQIVKYKTNRPHKYSEAEMTLNKVAGAIAHTIREEGTRTFRKQQHIDVYDTILQETADDLRKQLVGVITPYIKETIMHKYQDYSY